MQLFHKRESGYVSVPLFWGEIQRVTVKCVGHFSFLSTTFNVRKVLFLFDRKSNACHQESATLGWTPAVTVRMSNVLAFSTAV